MRGRLKKMDGVKRGTILEGAKGKYKIGKMIDEGGNGFVYKVQAVDWKVPCPYSNYVVKVLKKSHDRKRISRFRKEIQVVQALQEDNKGIVPILDYFPEGEKLQWYLMPKAEPYIYWEKGVVEVLESFVGLGEILNNIHSLGYAHRDIKPDNIMFLDGRLCLTDFGLVWKEDDTINITDDNDHVGPLLIRPRELETINLNAKIDYRTSDVYLFAKTLWIVLMRNKRGFAGEYNRGDGQIYLDATKLDTNMTLEPLHQLMEGATKDDFNERISLDEVLEYISNQIRVLSHAASDSEMNGWKYDESIKHSISIAEKSAIIIDDRYAMLNFLDEIKRSTAILLIIDGRTMNLGVFADLSLLDNDIVIVRTVNANIEKRVYLKIKKIEYLREHKCFLYCEEYQDVDGQVNVSSIDEKLYFCNEFALTNNAKLEFCIIGE